MKTVKYLVYLEKGVGVDLLLVVVVEVDALRLHLVPRAVRVLQGHADAAALSRNRTTRDGNGDNLVDQIVLFY